MKTVLTDSPEHAAEFLKNGGIVAFPTETVYGLGANVFEEGAVAKVFAAKGRPTDNPLIAHISDIEQLAEITSEANENARLFIDEFFPGPLTLVLPKSDRVPLIATAGLDTIGVRMPGNALAHAFLVKCGVPVVAPSANLSGRPSPTTWQAVLEDLDGSIDCILRGEATEIGLESTVVDCSLDVPVLLRQGSVSIEDLRRVVPATVAYLPGSDDVIRSPGLKHKHYSPRAKVVLVDLRFEISDLKFENAAYIGLNQRDYPFAEERICKSVADYAHSIFEFFRKCDRSGIDAICCETVPEVGLGAALMDRLRRASEPGTK